MTPNIPNIEAHLVGWAHFHHSTNPSAPFGDGWREVVAGWAGKVCRRELKLVRGIYTCARLAMLDGRIQEIHNPRIRQAIQIAQSPYWQYGIRSGDDVPGYTIRRKRGEHTI